MPKVKFCLFASTPDMSQLDFVVKVLTGTPEELGRTAMSWGYNGIEFMPDPEHTPDPELFNNMLERTGAAMPVVNSGRIAAQGMALLHEDITVRKISIEGFKRILDFAGYFKARVGLGASRGRGIPGMSKADTLELAEEIFRELTEHARKVGAIIMLEPAEAVHTSGAAEIYFLPENALEDVTITLAGESGRLLELGVDGLTGRVKITEAEDRS